MNAYLYVCDRGHHVVSDVPVVYPAWDTLPPCPHDGCTEVLRRVVPRVTEEAAA